MSPDKREKSLNRAFVIGTSGHIDHGKTTLVKALTGIDTDRLEEEKKRGITIDLGFANYEDEKGNNLAFVDVPGHEKFVHNMLAGIAGLDAIMLVVAADEGIMPQTREHLNICNLLKVRTGLVVITRTDLVQDSEILALCKEEIVELLKGTFLESKQIIPVSAENGSGLIELKAALSEISKQLPKPEVEKPFRLNVDRSFTVKGFGTIVTGTVLSGSIREDQTVQQYPEQRKVRIRGLQSQGQTVSAVSAGQRAAINLAGIGKESIKRGDQLADAKSLLTSYMVNAYLNLLGEASETLKNRTRIRLHIGSNEVFGRIIILEGHDLKPGENTMVQFRLENKVSTRHGDRFIIRSFSQMTTIGGGMVIDPYPSKSRRVINELPIRLRLLKDGDEITRSSELIYMQSLKGVFEDEFSIRSGLSSKKSYKVLKLLQSQKKVICVDPFSNRYLHIQHVERVCKFLNKVIAKHHEVFADRNGMTRPEIGGKISLIFKEREIDILLKFMIDHGYCVKNGSHFALPIHQPYVSENLEQSFLLCLEMIKAGGFQPFRKTRLFEELKMNEKDGIKMIRSATYSKQLVRVSEDLYYTSEQIKKILSILKVYLHENKNITVLEFKELLNISRKHAVDLLEYFDSQRLTIRKDNHRVPGSIMNIKK